MSTKRRLAGEVREQQGLVGSIGSFDGKLLAHSEQAAEMGYEQPDSLARPLNYRGKLPYGQLVSQYGNEISKKRLSAMTKVFII